MSLTVHHSDDPSLFVIEVDMPEDGKTQVHWYGGLVQDPVNSRIAVPMWSPYWEDAKTMTSQSALIEWKGMQGAQIEAKIVPVPKARKSDTWTTPPIIAS